jgi:hypothetical protein
MVTVNCVSLEFGALFGATVLVGAEIIGVSIGFQMLTIATIVDAIIMIKYIISGIFHRRSFLWLLSDLNFIYIQILISYVDDI